MKSVSSAVAPIIGGLCLLVFTFWATSRVLDYWDANKIQVVEASYGSNCNAPIGNVTDKVSSACMVKMDTCSYLIDVNTIGDTAPGCPKDFSAKWRCRPSAEVHQLNVQAEANGKTANLSCLAKFPD
jgi:hypothetical protein